VIIFNKFILRCFIIFFLNGELCSFIEKNGILYSAILRSFLTYRSKQQLARDVVWSNRWYAETLRKLHSILSGNDIAMNLYWKMHEIHRRYMTLKRQLFFTPVRYYLDFKISKASGMPETFYSLSVADLVNCKILYMYILILHILYILHILHILILHILILRNNNKIIKPLRQKEKGRERERESETHKISK